MLKLRLASKPLSWRAPATIGAVGLAAGIAAVLLLTGGESGDRERQAAVAERGAEVMPFDLDRTSHVFTPAASGGVQEVIADDPADAGQIRLIREHVQAEAARFARGDFDDPTAVHGDDMPGLATLRTEYSKMTAAYTELPDGAKITYVSRDPSVIKALHAWFEAQLGDHGDHAERGGQEH